MSSPLDVQRSLDHCMRSIKGAGECRRRWQMTCMRRRRGWEPHAGEIKHTEHGWVAQAHGQRGDPAMTQTAAIRRLGLS